MRDRASPLLVALALVCASGIVLRFTNPGGKACYLDESATALRVGGHTVRELCDFLEKEGPVRPSEVRRFQSLDRGRGVVDTVASLAIEEPQHPPLFYLLARCWAGFAGDSIAALRVWSAILGLLAIPGLVWLWSEMAGSADPGRASLAIWSFSPIFVVYAQDAREYGLWAALVIVASAAMLRAVRTGTGWWWYGLLAAAGLYTSLLFVVVLAAHTVWAVGDRRARTRWKALASALAFAVACFIPWVVAGFGQRTDGLEQIAWMQAPRALSGLVRAWVFVAGTVVYDVRGAGVPDRAAGLAGVFVAATAMVGLIEWWRSPDRRFAVFVAGLILCNALPLVAMDVVFGGIRSTVPRFLVAAWVGELLLLARVSCRRPWLLCSLILLGLVACLVRVPARTWWNQYSGPRHVALAEVIDAAEAPLLLAVPRGHHFNLLTLSHLLGEHVCIASRGAAYDGRPYSDVFVLSRPDLPGDEGLELVATLVLDTGGERLWRLDREPGDGGGPVSAPAIPRRGAP